ncbi:MAG: OmpA family protein [Myxococcota bacterium]
MNSVICKRAAFGSLLLAMGCASTGPTPELVDARRAYDQARMSQAKDLAPDKLQGAREALEQAERAHGDDAGSRKERDLAYIATRKSELAMAYGQLAANQRLRKEQEERYSQAQDRLRRNAEQRAESNERSLQAATGALARTQSELNSQRNETANERQARLAAEQRADAAVQSLRQIASVQEESRGLVITLEGAVLFTTGKSELIPLAQQKLDQVAEALKQSDSPKIVVEGHTDSRGADDANMKLSQQRAEAVRNYLVSRGVKAESISAMGRGETNPIASNETPEGRANNRRVEIIVQPKSQGQGGPSGAAPASGTWNQGGNSMSGSGSNTGSANTGSSTQGRGTQGTGTQGTTPGTNTPGSNAPGPNAPSTNTGSGTTGNKPR